MAKKDKQGSQPASERQLPNLKTVAKAIEAQRRDLAQLQAIVHTNANLLNEAYRFERGEADLGYCADVVCDMLGKIIGALEPLTIAPEQDGPPRDPMTLAHKIEAPRQQLFRAQAVAQAIENLMQAHQFEEGEANLSVVFHAFVEMMEKAISALEPLRLGLPIPE